MVTHLLGQQRSSFYKHHQRIHLQQGRMDRGQMMKMSMSCRGMIRRGSILMGEVGHESIHSNMHRVHRVELRFQCIRISRKRLNKKCVVTLILTHKQLPSRLCQELGVNHQIKIMSLQRNNSTVLVVTFLGQMQNQFLLKSKETHMIVSEQENNVKAKQLTSKDQLSNSITKRILKINPTLQISIQLCNAHMVANRNKVEQNLKSSHIDAIYQTIKSISREFNMLFPMVFMMSTMMSQLHVRKYPTS